MEKKRTWLTALGVFVILAGCTSTAPTQASNLPTTITTMAPVSNESQVPVSTAIQPVISAAVDACSLLTVQEVEAVLGENVGTPKPENTPPTYACDYEASAINSLSIIVVDFGNAITAAEAFQAILTSNNYEEVSGIGDRAMRPAIMDIDVIKGQYDVSIGIYATGTDKDTNYQNARSLAEKALSRLP